MKTNPFVNRSWVASGLFCLVVAVAGFQTLSPSRVPAGRPAPAGVIAQELRGFNVVAGVLYIAAHPDDENTQLLAFLARGRQYRTAYLSMTRGDGGQNVLGSEFGEELGVIRTEELLVARGIDGARQFFTRAIDFGYSKNPDETLRIWNRVQVLSDVVRVIRTFRPDVVITGFSPEPAPGQHGQHTASAILGLEAFNLAGDAKAFPEQLDRLSPWQPKRILMNRRGGAVDEQTVIRIDVGGSDPITGESFASIAGRSRSQHKTQGFGNFTGRGGSGPSYVSLAYLAGEPATRDIMDGIDTTWARIPGGAPVGRLTSEAIDSFDPEHPALSVPSLLAIRTAAAALPSDPIVAEKRSRLDHIIQECLGLVVESTVHPFEAVPGETLDLHNTVTLQSPVVPVRWKGVHAPGLVETDQPAQKLRAGLRFARDARLTLPADTPLSQPYWLRADAAQGLYRVDDPALIGRPEDPPAVLVRFDFEIGGQTFVIPVVPAASGSEAGAGVSRLESPGLEVIAPVALRFASGVRLFGPGSVRPLTVEARALRPGIDGALRIEAPSGWEVSPPSQTVHLDKAGDVARFSFDVTAPRRPAEGILRAQALVGGHRYDNARVEIRYGHIPAILLQPPARIKAVSLDLKTRGRRVGYLPGAGDSVAEALTQMDYEVVPLSGADLTAEGLRGLDAVVTGVRAFNALDDIVSHLPALFDFVKSGGNVIEQYNRPTGLQTDRFAPYSISLSNDRVTDEEAAVTFLAPDHPALTTPNRITSADFGGWIQERGIYLPSRWDDAWIPVLACGDPGEAPLKGGLLVAQYGRGYFVYTGLVFFRELPAGVPGAYRLFANLVSLGKE